MLVRRYCNWLVVFVEVYIALYVASFDDVKGRDVILRGMPQ
jgi:hypothetical protein